MNGMAVKRPLRDATERVPPRGQSLHAPKNGGPRSVVAVSESRRRSVELRVLLPFLLLFPVALRAANLDGRPVPKLVCPEPEYSFGSLVNTQEVVHEFVIRNEGDASLIINQVKMPCGCMLLRLMNVYLYLHR